MELTGLHHVSAMTANAAANVTFYTETLGLRLVKKTVNQDDTSSYHLFYGDERGNAGTEVTFFDIPLLAQNRRGNNSISTIGLRVPSRAALSYWLQRFEQRGIDHDGLTAQYGRDVLPFRDVEGQRLSLIADHAEEGVPPGTPWDQSPVPAAVGIVGLGATTLTVPNLTPTATVLTDIMGFREVGHYEHASPDTADTYTVTVFETGPGGNGAQVNVAERPNLEQEQLGYGGVHHLAFRVPDDEQYQAWLEHLNTHGIRNSGPIDRFYFRSIYFREPNGILYELATDGPGFTTDEDVEHLGERLSLPPFLEQQRAAIEAKLQPLSTRR